MKKKVAVMAAACSIMLFSLEGCASGNRISVTDNTTESVEWKTVVSIKDQAVPLYSKPEKVRVKIPVASGTLTFTNESVTVDASNANHGYVMVKYTGSASKIKVQVLKDSGELYTYDLNARSDYEVFPLTEGSGTYTVRILEQVQGTQYAVKASNDIQVSLVDEFEPFLYPNQYVDFSNESAVVQKASELAASAPDAIGVVKNVYNYVIQNFSYDTALADSVQSGYLPNVDEVLAKKKGICFDYAAVMTAMLRSENIPTKLVIGYTGNLYHAWVNVYIDGQGWMDNIIYFDGTSWKLMDPTFASSSGNDPAVKEYMMDSSNYKEKYTY